MQINKTQDHQLENVRQNWSINVRASAKFPSLRIGRRFNTRQTAGMAEKLLLCAAVCFTAIVPAAATDLSYTMQSPNFGGTNGTSLQAAQYAQSLRQQQAQQRAAAAAALTSASNNTPAQQFANSLVSQLQSLVARNVALQIAGSSPGAAGTISANGVSITYVNQDGVLNVTIAAPSGTTTFSLPTGG